jgi:hypothetical protein
MGRVLTLATIAAAMATSAMAGPYTARPAPGGGVTAPAVSAAARASCGERLANKIFRCSVAAEDGSTFEDCFRFFSPGAVSDKFDLAPDQLGASLGCTCKAKGKPKRPKFGVSPAFECTGAEDVSFEGTVSGNGKKIGKGFIANAAGGSFVYGCTLVPDCAL